MATLNQIGDIRIFAEVHNGPITRVFKGYQASLERIMLVKALNSEMADDQQITARFEREAKLIAGMQHPNVVTIFDYGEDQGLRYFSMEFIEGVTLKKLIKSDNLKHRLPIEVAVFVIKEITKGLHAAHQNHIIHQDIKPDNIFIAHDGQVKLGDFGLAVTETNTKAAPTSGTPEYFSPEQVLGEPLTPVSDIFSLGVTFYESLCGLKPFNGASNNELFHSILNDDPMPYLRKVVNIPDQLVELCEKMLSKKVEDRFNSCQTLLAEFDAICLNHSMRANAAKLCSFIAKPDQYERQKFEKNIPLARASQPKARWPFYFSAIVILALIVTFGLNSISQKTNIENLNAKPDSVAFGSAIHQTTPKTPDKTVAAPSIIEASAAAKQLREKNNSIPIKSEKSSRVSIPEEQTPAIIITPSDFGYLQLTCSPWATVYLNKEQIGVTPLSSVLKLATGRHQLELRNPQFPYFSDSIEVKGNETVQFSFSFWSTVGQLFLTVSPWAKVYIDGEYRDTVPPQDQPFIVPAGRHKLRLEHPALGDWETDFHSIAGDVVKLNLNLRNLTGKD